MGFYLIQSVMLSEVWLYFTCSRHICLTAAAQTTSDLLMLKPEAYPSVLSSSTCEKPLNVELPSSWQMTLSDLMTSSRTIQFSTGICKFRKYICLWNLKNDVSCGTFCFQLIRRGHKSEYRLPSSGEGLFVSFVLMEEKKKGVNKSTWDWSRMWGHDKVLFL